MENNTKEYRNVTLKLHPLNEDTAEKLNRHLGSQRWGWNYFLAKNQKEMDLYNEGKLKERPNIQWQGLMNEFTQLKKEEIWLQELYSSAARYFLKYYSDAWKQCFRKKEYIHGKGYPKFKKKHKGDSVTFPEPQGFKVLENNKLILSKIGKVGLTGSNQYKDEKPVRVIIKKDNFKKSKYKATICYEIDPVEKNDNKEVVGIDVGVRNIRLHDGTKFELPDMSRLEEKKKYHQRKIKGLKVKSNQWIKHIEAVKRIDAKIANIRKMWHYEIVNYLAEKYQYVVVEDLNIQGMTRSAKGTDEDPGKNVKAKSGLNREILKTGWGQLFRILNERTTVVKVNPSYTSQECSKCGYVSKKNRNGSVFICQECKFESHADTDAAIVIRERGIKKNTL